MQFLLFLFCWVLEIPYHLNEVADRVQIPFLCLQRCWSSYPTKTLTISRVFEYLLGYILNSIYVVLWDLYTCPSWVFIPKKKFVGPSYPIDFLGHSLIGTTNYKSLLSQQTPKNSAKFRTFLFCQTSCFWSSPFNPLLPCLCSYPSSKVHIKFYRTLRTQS